MKNTIIAVITIASGLAVGGFIGFYTARKRYHKVTGGSFRETYEDNSSDSVDFMADWR